MMNSAFKLIKMSCVLTEVDDWTAAIGRFKVGFDAKYLGFRT